MSTDRLAARFAKCKSEYRAALVTYIMAGDPDLETSYAALCALRDAGADIIELGMPFTDPMADGPEIQKAAIRSLAQGTKLSDVLALAARFRAGEKDTPLILMGYANPVHAMGYEAFASVAAQAGVDGTILVDLPPEEDGPLRAALSGQGLSVIRLVTPTTDRARLTKITDGASGFLYYVSVAGVTGAASADPETLRAGIALAREVSGLPICVGFGIRTGAQAAAMGEIADGVVVGSAFVEQARLAQEEGRPEKAVGAMGDLARTLSAALRDNKAALPI